MNVIETKVSKMNVLIQVLSNERISIDVIGEVNLRYQMIAQNIVVEAVFLY